MYTVTNTVTPFHTSPGAQNGQSRQSRIGSETAYPVTSMPQSGNGTNGFSIS